MRNPYRSERRDALAAWLVLALVFAIAVALTLAAVRARVNQRRVVRLAMGRFAHSTAWTAAARMEARLIVSLTRLFKPIGVSVDATPRLSDGPQLVRMAIDSARACNCIMVLEPIRAFAMDVATGRVIEDGATVWPDTPRIAAQLTTFVRTRFQPRWEGALVSVGSRAEPRFVALTVFRDRRGDPARVYGFEVARESLQRDLIAWVVDSTDILPVSIEIPQDSLVQVVVVDDNGARLTPGRPRFASPNDGVVTMAPYAAALVVRAALGPEAEKHFLPGADQFTSVMLPLGMLFALAALLATTALLFRKATALATARANFTSSVSHELKTPLTQILLYAETMMHGRLPDMASYRREAGVIVGEARHLVAMIDNVLHAARLGDVQLPLTLAPVVLADAAEPVVRAVEARWREQGLTLRCECDRTVAALIDRGAFQTVLRNVLDNAAKYGEGSPIALRISRVEAQAMVTIDDGGPGIPEADRERVWMPFVRLDETAGTAGGSGVGLAVVRDLTHRLGGSAEITNSASGGTRVLLVFRAIDVLSP